MGELSLIVPAVEYKELKWCLVIWHLRKLDCCMQTTKVQTRLCIPAVVILSLELMVVTPAMFQITLLRVPTSTGPGKSQKNTCMEKLWNLKKSE